MKQEPKQYFEFEDKAGSEVLRCSSKIEFGCANPNFFFSSPFFFQFSCTFRAVSFYRGKPILNETIQRHFYNFQNMTKFCLPYCVLQTVFFVSNIKNETPHWDHIF